ncbi:hypothetical protein L7F22_033006 [Adiantum nelumboides]|nr:hypothetical protein [Adiantum nelumboides]
MADRPDDVIEEVSSPQGKQTHEVGESARPPQSDGDILRTQFVAAVTMFSQVMQNPRFLAFVQPPLPCQQVGSQEHMPEAVLARTHVMHTANSMGTRARLSESMQTPKPMPMVQEQVVFGFLYILNLGIVLAVYLQAKVIPWWAFCLLCLSKRVHSIFVLRLFNDCIATTLAHFSILLFLKNRWNFGLAVFSVAVSVKMSVLLYAPPLLLLMFKALSLLDIAAALFIAAILQVLLGMPFLWFYPWEYCSKAFDLGRVFIHFWSVNFKFVPEAVFVSKGFALALVTLHLSLLVLFAHCKWCKHEHGLLPALNLRFKLQQIARLLSSAPNKLFGKGTQVMLEPKHIATVLFTGNFIGILCARSLHYQFYSWYFYSLPYLLWRTPFPTFLRLIIFGVIEACWNIYPSNSISSLVLLACHLTLLLGLWLGPCESPYAQPAVEKSE